MGKIKKQNSEVGKKENEIKGVRIPRVCIQGDKRDNKLREQVFQSSKEGEEM